MMSDRLGRVNGEVDKERDCSWSMITGKLSDATAEGMSHMAVDIIANV